MNGAHLHLVVNHLPVLLAPVGLGLGVYALARRQDDVLRAALGVLVLTAVAAFAANWTGAGAEHVLEAAVPSVSEVAIHAHEGWPAGPPSRPTSSVPSRSGPSSSFAPPGPGARSCWRRSPSHSA